MTERDATAECAISEQQELIAPLQAELAATGAQKHSGSRTPPQQVTWSPETWPDWGKAKVELEENNHQRWELWAQVNGKESPSEMPDPVDPVAPKTVELKSDLGGMNPGNQKNGHFE